MTKNKFRAEVYKLSTKAWIAISSVENMPDSGFNVDLVMCLVSDLRDAAMELEHLTRIYQQEKRNDE